MTSAVIDSFVGKCSIRRCLIKLDSNIEKRESTRSGELLSVIVFCHRDEKIVPPLE